MEKAAEIVPTVQPCLIAAHKDGKLQQCFLVIERTITAKVGGLEAVVVLFAAFLCLTSITQLVVLVCTQCWKHCYLRNVLLEEDPVSQ